MDQTSAAPTPPGAWTTRKTAIATLVVLGVAVAFYILFNYRMVFFSLFVAIVLSTAIEPLVERMARIGIPRPISIIIISLLVVALIILLVVLLTPRITEQTATISAMVSSAYQDIYQAMMNTNSVIIHRILQQFPPYLPLSAPGLAPAQLPSPSDVTQPPPMSLAQQALNIGATVMHSLILGISVLLLTGLWTVEGETATRFFILGLPTARRDSAREFLGHVELKIGAYTRGLALMLLIIGVMAGIAYVIIGLPNALMLAIIAGVMEIVPLIGPALGAIPAILVAASTDPTKVIWVILAYTVIQLAESHLIVPRVMDRTVGVNPVASLLAFIAFGSLFGFLGAVLAVPLAAVLQLLLNRFVFNAPPAEQVPLAGRNVISSLRYEAQDLIMDVRKQVREKDAEVTAREDRVEDTMEAIVADLDSLLAQAEDTSENGASENGRARA